MKDQDWDNVVIGAGTAELAAARKLSGAGRRVLILEARDRVGGRIHTVREAGTLLPIELGAEFVHGTPAETWDIIRAARLAAYDVADTHWFLQDGILRFDETFWGEMESILGRLDQIKEPDLSFAEFLRRYGADASEHTKERVLAYVEGFDAADPEHVSARGLADEQQASRQIEEERSFRLIDGYDRIIHWLLAGLDPNLTTTRLNTVVTGINWARGSVQVSALSGGTPQVFHASRLLVTLPLGVLKAAETETGAVRFDPALPEKREAAGRLEMGPVVKVIFQFTETFWERQRLPTVPEGQSLQDAGFLHGRGPPFFTWWTQLPVRSSVWVGWSGGPAAAALSHRTRDHVIEQALTSLSTFFGLKREELDGQLERATVCDWQADPFSRGAYSYALVGAKDARAVLARPVDDTLFFAGEATHEGQCGTVAGALASGYRAADEMLASHRV